MRKGKLRKVAHVATFQDRLMEFREVVRTELDTATDEEVRA